MTAASLTISAQAAPTKTRIALAFAAIYCIWGSTYYAINVVVKVYPPFMMASIRFVIAGIILCWWTRRRARRIGERLETPTRVQWRSAAIVGAFLLVGGNGGVVWSSRFVPSGLTALVVASLPLWMALLEWLRPQGKRPRLPVILGILLGCVGLILLIGMDPKKMDGRVAPSGVLVLTMASFSWAWGSLYARQAPLPKSALLATGMEMIAGGALLMIPSILTGELSWSFPHEVTWKPLAAMFYLILAGSLIGYTSYIWLLGVTTPSKLSTYAYVNPIVALLIGCTVGNETLTQRTVVAAVIILTAVVIMVSYRTASPRRES